MCRLAQISSQRRRAEACEMTLLPDSGPAGKVPTDLEGCDDEAGLDDVAVMGEPIEQGGGQVNPVTLSIRSIGERRRARKMHRFKIGRLLPLMVVQFLCEHRPSRTINTIYIA